MFTIFACRCKVQLGNRSGHHRENWYPIGPMRWCLTIILVGWSLTGCKNPAPVTDPFFGRSTIPPPPTGSVTGRPGEPNYQPAPSISSPSPMPGIATPPVVQIPPQTPASASTYQPNISPQPNTYPASPPVTPTAPSTSPPAVSSPPGISPSLLGPRPSSTGSGVPSAPRTAPPGYLPGSTGSYTPPSNSLRYPGASARGSAPLVPTRLESRPSAPLFGGTAMMGVSNSSAGRSSTDRMPRPVEEAAAAGGAAGAKTIAPAIPPRGRDDASDRPVDIADLPKTPSGEP